MKEKRILPNLLDYRLNKSLLQDYDPVEVLRGIRKWSEITTKAPENRGIEGEALGKAAGQKKTELQKFNIHIDEQQMRIEAAKRRRDSLQPRAWPRH